MSDSGQLHAKKEQFAKVPCALIHDRRITAGALRCYAHMHWRYGRNHLNFEGLQSIAKYLGVSEKAISNYIKELESYSWIVVIERDLNKRTKRYQTPFYHIFESKKQAQGFRRSYKTIEDSGERLRPLSAPAARKSRGGVGGKPSHKPKNSSSDVQQNSSSVEIQSNSSSDVQQNSSSDYPDVVKALNPDTVTPAPQKSRKAKREYDDVPKDDRLQIIRAWVTNISIEPIGAYDSYANNAVAADIFRAGYRSHQVALFVKAKMLEDYWIGKPLTLKKVAEFMPQWLLTTYPSGNKAVKGGVPSAAPSVPAPIQRTPEELAALRAQKVTP